MVSGDDFREIVGMGEVLNDLVMGMFLVGIIVMGDKF